MSTINLQKVAYYLIPLITISPALRLGSYGILITDIVVILTGMAIFSKGSLMIKKNFLIFLLLFTLGWMGSNLWALVLLRDKPQIAEINHLYRIFFYYSAFWIGYNSKYSLEEILSSKFTRYTLIILASFVLLYFISDTELREKLMRIYDSEEVHELRKNRFPGLNSNINIFSFIIVIISIFSFYYLMHGNKKVIIPFITTSFVLFAGRSRKVMAFYLFFILIYFVKYYFFDAETRLIKHYRINRKVAISILIIIICTFLGGYMFAKSTSGKRIIASFEILLLDEDKTQDLRSYYGTNSDFNSRFFYMKKGLERVGESPFFGIPKLRDSTNTTEKILFFHKAHNEFIVIWMYYGLLALLGFFFFFINSIYFNYKRRQFIWTYLYIILIFQAFFDTAFFSYQLCSMLFIFVGLNYKDES
jgi:hypothetical protein